MEKKQKTSPKVAEVGKRNKSPVPKGRAPKKRLDLRAVENMMSNRVLDELK